MTVHSDISDHLVLVLKWEEMVVIYDVEVCAVHYYSMTYQAWVRWDETKKASWDKEGAETYLYYVDAHSTTK